jgi:hypothetical protein
MTPTLTRSPAPLRDVLYEFSLAKEVPDAELIDAFVRRYPEHAAAVTDFAIELVLDSLQRDEGEQERLDPVNVSPVVSRAMSRFQNKLHEVEADRVTAAQPASRAAPPADVSNPFARFGRDDFRAVARQLNVNTVFLCKLRDRQIDPMTMTNGFKHHVAEGVKATFDVMVTHLAGSPQTAGPQPQYYKATEKPDAGTQQSFEDAVRSSGLTEEQQRYLLSL